MNTHAMDRNHQGKPWWSEDGLDNDGVVASGHDVVSGHTIAKWTENWWQWALQAPNGPFNSDSQSIGQGRMTFIAGEFNDPNLASATIHASAYTPILFPMINAFDTEGLSNPKLETIPNFVNDGRGSYADEARFVTNLFQRSIYDAHATLTMDAGNGHTKTIFDVHLQGSEAADAGVQSGIFALGAPVTGSFIAQLLDGITLDPSIKDLPFTRSTGDWIEIDGLKPGTYTLAFGGSGHAVVDPVSGTPIAQEGWGASVKDTLIIK